VNLPLHRAAPILGPPAVAVLALAAALMLGAAPGVEAQQDGLIPLAAFPRERIVVETRSARRHEIEAWRADTPQTHEQGLMFVREMREDQAMIFVYEPPRYVAMWMKNTLLPLDMLFVNQYGCVVNVKRDARPGSLATIAADTPVALVVELKGGVANALGVDAGDRVLRPEAGWPGGDHHCTRKP
jgi:uncharacterized membrane protein (UPF0127 family)